MKVGEFLLLFLQGLHEVELAKSLLSCAVAGRTPQLPFQLGHISRMAASQVTSESSLDGIFGAALAPSTSLRGIFHPP